MFLKSKTPLPCPLRSRITRPVHFKVVDYIHENADGSTEIRQKTLSPEPEPFRDLGNADCYGIAYLQSRGVELKEVESRNRVSPMEAINIANKAIDNLHISNEN